MQKSKEHVIVLHETTLQSWCRDASTFSLFVGLIGLGVFLDSGAMQWMGAIFAFFAVSAKATGLHKRSRKTIAEARAFLNELEAAA